MTIYTKLTISYEICQRIIVQDNKPIETKKKCINNFQILQVFSDYSDFRLFGYSINRLNMLQT